MTLTNLTEDEKQIVFECLKCVASGKVILHDWEFPIIMGVELEELQAIGKSISDYLDAIA